METLDSETLAATRGKDFFFWTGRLQAAFLRMLPLRFIQVLHLYSEQLKSEIWGLSPSSHTLDPPLVVTQSDH